MRAGVGGSLVLMGMLMGCSWQGPALAGHPGLQYQVTSYYQDNAIEKGMSCTQPAMTPVDTQVLNDTPERVVLHIRYHWYDANLRGQSLSTGSARRSGSGRGFCNGWSERTFTFRKTPDGGLQLVGMTGAQRG